MSSTDNSQTDLCAPTPRSIIGYPKHNFENFSDQEIEGRKAKWYDLIASHFPKAKRHLDSISNLPDDFGETYFGGKFGRIVSSSVLLEAALASDLISKTFDDYLNIVLSTFSIRAQNQMASFESLGLLDHYITLQKFAEADIPSFTIEGMLSFGEMAPIRNILGVTHSDSFWQNAKESLSVCLDQQGVNLFVTFIKRSLQMPHRLFRLNDIDKLDDRIEKAFRPPITDAEKASSYKDAIHNWTRPEDIVQWAGKNYSYDFDRGSIMSGSNELTVYEPHEFFALGSGVCIDFSHFIYSTLEKINPNIKPYLFRMEYVTPNDFRGNPFISHWSTAYELDDQWYVLGDSKLGGMISGPYDSLDEYREQYSRYRGLEYHRHDLYDNLPIFYDLPR